MKEAKRIPIRINHQRNLPWIGEETSLREAVSCTEEYSQPWMRVIPAYYVAFFCGETKEFGID
jgi:hypothetical protein